MAQRRITKEMKDILQYYHGEIHVELKNPNTFDELECYAKGDTPITFECKGYIRGPEDTPYEGGIYRFEMFSLYYIICLQFQI